MSAIMSGNFLVQRFEASFVIAVEKVIPTHLPHDFCRGPNEIVFLILEKKPPQNLINNYIFYSGYQ